MAHEHEWEESALFAVTGFAYSDKEDGRHIQLGPNLWGLDECKTCHVLRSGEKRRVLGIQPMLWMEPEREEPQVPAVVLITPAKDSCQTDLESSASKC